MKPASKYSIQTRCKILARNKQLKQKQPPKSSSKLKKKGKKKSPPRPKRSFVYYKL